jgi:hypothetical protein
MGVLCTVGGTLVLFLGGWVAVGATLGKTIFTCVFKGKIIKRNLKIRYIRRVQIYIQYPVQMHK